MSLSERISYCKQTKKWRASIVGANGNTTTIGRFASIETAAIARDVAAYREYAKDYGYIIVLGLPFMMVCTTINSIIRADGNPRYAMISMLIGAVMNVILDPIFIFVVNMGVKGAAIATVISQIVSFLLNVAYLRKLKSIELKKNFQFRLSASARVSALGISSFITQLFAALVMGLQNNLLKTYGAMSVYGSEIPITVLGIVVKINEILNSIVLGLATGSLPIIAYNFGAQNYGRVKKTLDSVYMRLSQNSQPNSDTPDMNSRKER